MSAKKLIIFCLGVLLVLASVVGWNWLRDNKLPNFYKSSEIYVYPHTTAEELVQMIEDKCGIRSRESLERVFKSKKVSQYMKPGHYWISYSNSSVYVARMINNSWQSPVKLTLAGNLRIKSNIAAKVGDQLMLDSLDFANALNDNALLSEYGFSSSDVFSLIFPDTYDIYWTASVRDVLDKQKEAWDAFWTEENDTKAEKLGLSRKEVSVLASIVKAETNYEPEMPKVAGVYLNRIKLGIPLQADPTVAFCFDYKLNRILFKHLEVDSPYNTYRNPGLPPGPICVPTKACLQAVLDADYGAGMGPGEGEPGRGGNIFFCASPEFNGTHVFARSNAEHEANARAYRKALDRRIAERKKKSNG